MYEGLVPRITKTFINQSNDKYQHELEEVTRITQCPDCRGGQSQRQGALSQDPRTEHS